MNEGIVHADRRYRRKILTIYIILVLLGVVLIEWGLPWAEEYLERLDPKRALRVVAVVLAVQFLIIVPIALYLFAYGRKVIKYERNPPPGIKVIWDTKVIQGRIHRKMNTIDAP